MDYCLYRGDVTPDDNHLRLCTVCSSTRSFGADMWPEYINEATCSAEDNGCLFTDDVCKYLNILPCIRLLTVLLNVSAEASVLTMA